MNMREYRLELDRVRSRSSVVVARLVRSVYANHTGTRAQLLDAVVEAIYDVVLESRRAAYEAAIEWLKSEAVRQLGQGLDPDTDVYLPDESGYQAQAVRSVLRETLRGNVEEALGATLPRLEQHVESAARQTVTRAVEDGWEPEDPDDNRGADFTRLMPSQTPDDVQEPGGRGKGKRRPKAYARVLSGAENCGFCVMLASRGPVYKTAATAGAPELANGMDQDASRYRNSYHPNCDCVAVPVYDRSDWPGKDQYAVTSDYYRKHITDAVWVDDDGEVHEGIRYNDGPGGGRQNEVIKALEKALRNDPVEVPSIRG